MNTDTGQIKELSELTEDEKKSGKWKPMADALLAMSPAGRARLKRNEDYMKRVQEKRREAQEVK